MCHNLRREWNKWALLVRERSSPLSTSTNLDSDISFVDEVSPFKYLLVFRQPSLQRFCHFSWLHRVQAIQDTSRIKETYMSVVFHLCSNLYWGYLEKCFYLHRFHDFLFPKTVITRCPRVQRFQTIPSIGAKTRPVNQHIFPAYPVFNIQQFLWCLHQIGFLAQHLENCFRWFEWISLWNHGKITTHVNVAKKQEDFLTHLCWEQVPPALVKFTRILLILCLLKFHRNNRLLAIYYQIILLDFDDLLLWFNLSQFSQFIENSFSLLLPSCGDAAHDGGISPPLRKIWNTRTHAVFPFVNCQLLFLFTALALSCLVTLNMDTAATFPFNKLSNEFSRYFSAVDCAVLAVCCLAFWIIFSLVEGRVESVKSKSWIVTLISSSILSCFGLFHVVKTEYYSLWELDQIYTENIVSRNLMLFFLSANLMDLLIGWHYYRELLDPFSCYFHHTFYMCFILTLLAHHYATGFLLCFLLEIPTAVLAVGTVYKECRSDLLFGVTFLLTRVMYNTYLAYNLYVLSPDGAVWKVCVAVLCLHLFWFSKWWDY